MKTLTPGSLQPIAGCVLAACAFVATSVSGQRPALTSFAPDGTVSWSNATIQSVAVIEESTAAASNDWITVFAEVSTALVSQADVVLTNERAWFRAINADRSAAPANMVLVPGGSFRMGDNLGDGDEEDIPVHTVHLSPFYLGRHEVTNDEMAQVMGWAYGQSLVSANGSTVSNLQGDAQELLNLGSLFSQIHFTGGAFVVDPGKGDHPCVEVTWYGAVAFCNYRSQMEGSLTSCYDLDDWSCDWNADGYRLPTEAEWEKAARGGMSGERFPWIGGTIDHDWANYRAHGTLFDYDVSPYETGTFHPDYRDTGYPYTSPVGHFLPNGYGLHNMSGNVLELCWDRWQSDWYAQPEAAQDDTRGPAGPVGAMDRVLRGGAWYAYADLGRCAARVHSLPGYSGWGLGFRYARGL